MKTKHKLIAGRVLVLLGIMLGMECHGLSISSLPTQTRENIRGITHAIWNYSQMYDDEFPESLEELTKPLRNGVRLFLEKELLIDSWGEPIEYIRDGHQYIIRSSGPDRKMGTADDIFDGYPKSYMESWKAKYAQIIAEQETNAVQEATAGTTQPAAGIGKTQTNRIPVTGGQSSSESAEAENTPWEIPLLIGIIAFAGAITAWRFFRKKKG